MINERSFSIHRKTISEPQTVIEPAPSSPDSTRLRVQSLSEAQKSLGQGLTNVHRSSIVRNCCRAETVVFSCVNTASASHLYDVIH